jgi:hypothetical protein
MAAHKSRSNDSYETPAFRRHSNVVLVVVVLLILGVLVLPFVLTFTDWI